MTRKAIIIGNNTGYNATTFLSGVNRDLNNYPRYLKNNVGGAWYDFEIEIIHNKGRQTIINAIRQCNTDYSFVVFSGHGFINQADGLTYICVDGNYICETELKTNSLKQSLILDCCRTEESISEIAGAFGDVSSHFEKGGQVHRLSEAQKRIIRNARNKFDYALSKADYGQFRGYACSVGQTSGDNPSLGGVFSTALMKEGIKFSKINKEKYWMTIREAVNKTIATLENDPFTSQIPTYMTIPDSIRKTAPFAITNNLLNQ